MNSIRDFMLSDNHFVRITFELILSKTLAEHGLVMLALPMALDTHSEVENYSFW